MPPEAHERTLVCPGCGQRRHASERFCPDCKLPLVLPEDPELTTRYSTARHARMRKIKPQLAEGALVKVAWASNEPEAEFIQSLLLEQGVPSVLRRSAGFDVPDLLAAGPRDVLVAVSGADAAREALLQADVAPAARPSSPVAPGRLLAGILAALAVGALLIWLISLAAH